MARLNEPASSTIDAVAPSSMESVESLKRRFLRQNRDLARSNSTQSLKMRALESHISSLVAETVSLRAENNQLKIQLEDARAVQLLENVDTIKRALESKLRDFETLLSGLGEVGKKRPRKTLEGRRKSVGPSQKSRGQRPGQDDGAEGPDREGWLPTIVEGKHFPRRTLDPGQIEALVNHSASDSPEIGPPPRTFLDEHKGGEVQEPGGLLAREDNEVSGLLSANFETRKRRRETSVRRDSSELPPNETSPTKDIAKSSELLSGQPLRAGAQRKLDVSARPDEKAAQEALEATSYTFSKGRSTIRPAIIEVASISPIRKALAPKTVNTDPIVSPRKTSAKDAEKDKPSRRQIGVDNSDASKRRPLKAVAITVPAPMAQRIDTTDLHVDDDLLDIKAEPKTPAPLDLFSPASTQPSEVREEGRSGTPPPSNLMRSVGHPPGPVGRGSRRARANVSYAEPSLISKMRRPTKEMVDAVASGQSRNSIDVQYVERLKAEGSEARSARETQNNILRQDDEQSKRDVDASAEHETLQKPESPSPLGRREGIRSIEAEVEREVGTSANLARTGTGAAISGLIRDKPTTVSGARQAPEVLEVLEDGMRSLDVYDIADSPVLTKPRMINPPITTLQSRSRPPREPAEALRRPRSRNQDRPSSASANRLALSSAEMTASQLGPSQSAASLGRPKVAPRRQTLATEARKVVASGRMQGERAGQLTCETASVGDLATNTPPSSRTRGEKETALRRRRSMML